MPESQPYLFIVSIAFGVGGTSGDVMIGFITALSVWLIFYFMHTLVFYCVYIQNTQLMRRRAVKYLNTWLYYYADWMCIVNGDLSFIHFL